MRGRIYCEALASSLTLVLRGVGTGAQSSLQVIDVRDDDFAGGKIPGAINVPSEGRCGCWVVGMVNHPPGSASPDCCVSYGPPLVVAFTEWHEDEIIDTLIAEHKDKKLIVGATPARAVPRQDMSDDEPSLCVPACACRCSTACCRSSAAPSRPRGSSPG